MYIRTNMAYICIYIYVIASLICRAAFVLGLQCSTYAGIHTYTYTDMHTNMLAALGGGRRRSSALQK